MKGVFSKTLKSTPTIQEIIPGAFLSNSFRPESSKKTPENNLSVLISGGKV